jgi:hypothetical protein
MAGSTIERPEEPVALVIRQLRADTAGDFFDLTATVRLDGRLDGRDREITFRRHGDHPRLCDRTDTFDPFAVALLLPAMLAEPQLRPLMLQQM